MTRVNCRQLAAVALPAVLAGLVLLAACEAENPLRFTAADGTVGLKVVLPESAAKQAGNFDLAIELMIWMGGDNPEEEYVMENRTIAVVAKPAASVRRLTANPVQARAGQNI